MEYPKFEIPYKSAYTSELEFNTQINEKQKGKEQRYPVWTFPKRTFTLKFDKNPNGREELEQFFINVSGRAGKFEFLWEQSKGGNGEIYVCSFESDSFRQNIKNFGYSECELRFVAIDENPVPQVEDFNFWHKAECENSIDFYTVIEKVFTARREAKAYWDSPKKSWTLTFEKTPEVRKKLEDFFVAKRGKFHSFTWVWEKERGGDGKAYNVRFDNDILTSEVDFKGYGNIQVVLKEVCPTTNPLLEVEKDEIIPRKLLSIELKGGPIYILDNETLDSLTYEGKTFLGAPLSHGEINVDDNSAVNKLEITLSNVALSISAIIGQRGDVITNASALFQLVFLDVNNHTIVSDVGKVLFAGRCNNLKLSYENASVEIETSLGGYEIQAPVMKYRSSCQVRRFKDCRCGYLGESQTCDRTFSRCKELGNQTNFRGFPTMYRELVIKG